MIKHIITGTAVAIMLASSSALASGSVKDSDILKTQTKNEWFASNLIGRNVKNNDGKIVGDVNDLLFAENGKVRAVIVGVGGFLELGEKNVAIKFTAIKQKTDKKGNSHLYLDMSKDAIKKLPEFKKASVTPGFLTRMKENASQLSEQAEEAGSKAYDKTKELGEAAAEKASKMKKEITGESKSQ